MQHPTGVGITGDAVIGSRCTVHTGCTVARSDEGAPVLGDDVIIAPGARVIGTVNVDDGCHVAANAVLVRSIPGPWMVLGGVPAKAIRERQRLAQ
jgi:serine O-acetyltransferase